MQYVINYVPTIHLNKFNKMPVLTTHTADICRRVVVRWLKTLIFGIRQNELKINVIVFFDTNKNMNQFQEPPFLEAKTYVSCR